MKVRGLVRNDAKDGVKWRALSWGSKKANSHKSGKNGLKMFVVVVVFFRPVTPRLHSGSQNDPPHYYKKNYVTL